MCQTVKNSRDGHCHYKHRIHDFLKYIVYLQNNVVDICGYMQLILVLLQECTHHGLDFNHFSSKIMRMIKEFSLIS